MLVMLKKKSRKKKEMSCWFINRENNSACNHQHFFAIEILTCVSWFRS